MQMPRPIVAALVALAWLVPATDAAANLQIRVGQPQEESSLTGRSLPLLLTLQQERVGTSIQMHLPSIQTRTNDMSASSPAQALPSISLATSADGKGIHQGDTIIITWESINSPPGARGRSVSPEGAYGAYFRPDHDLATGERQLHVAGANLCISSSSMRA
jgi:hypothetical protein